MANSKLKCTNCGDRFPAGDMQKTPAGNFHSFDCLMEYANKGKAKAQKKLAAKAKADTRVKEKAARAKHKADKERIKKRTGKNGYYDNLKSELHFYVKHGLRKGEACYTCGKLQSHGDSGGAFHVGHFIPAGSVDPRRFMLENLRIQCYSCNVPNSGRRVEYRQRMIEEMGIDHVEWLECDANHKTLKEIFPDVSDIKAETARYRKLNKPIKEGH